MIKLNIKRTQKKIMKGFLNYKRRKKWSYKLRKLSISIVLFLFVCMSYVFLYALNQFSKEINESNNIQDISNIFLFFCYFAVMIEFVRSFILHTDSSIGSFMYKFIKSAIYLTALFFVFSVYFDKKVEEFDNVLFFFSFNYFVRYNKRINENCKVGKIDKRQQCTHSKTTCCSHFSNRICYFTNNNPWDDKCFIKIIKRFRERRETLAIREIQKVWKIRKIRTIKRNRKKRYKIKGGPTHA